jgi:endoglucanase
MIMRAVVVAVLVGWLGASAVAQAPDAFAQNRKIGRGVNVLGYDPIWRSRDQARFRAEYFGMLKEAGFDSVRVNLHPFRHMGPAPSYALPDSWYATLDWIVSEARKAGLCVILDMHEFQVMGKEPEANRERFLAFWRQLSDHCKGSPDSVIFEILNEPNSKLTPELWNAYMADALAIIRQDHPTRTVIVGPGFWNNVSHLDELKLPESDRNLIVTVHYYNPFPFTHQGAAWTDQKDKSGIAWEGTAAERKAVRDDFAKVAAWAKAHDRPFFVGEFGAYDKAPMESRIRWTDAVTRTIEDFGGSWAYWQFDGDFILYDVKKGEWVEAIRGALIPGK